MPKRITRDDIDRFHDYGIYIPQRTIYMGSENYLDDGSESGTDFLMAEKFIKNLAILDIASDEPITIIMNNLGGEVYDGLAIYDAILHSRSHVKIVVYGSAQSMGSIILQAADERVLAPNSVIMIHDGYMSVDGHPSTVYKQTEENKRIDTLTEDIYLSKIREKHPEFKRTKLKKMLKFDTFLTPEECVELGLADKLLGESNEENEG